MTPFSRGGSCSNMKCLWPVSNLWCESSAGDHGDGSGVMTLGAK